MDALQEQKLHCPYCGELITLLLDCMQCNDTYVEDCSVCCQPIEVTISPEEGEMAVTLSRENG